MAKAVGDSLPTKPEPAAVDYPPEPEPEPKPEQTTLPIAVEGEWIPTDTLLEVLTAQGIKTSERGLQDWAKKYQGTKEGFTPRYIAEKINNKWLWKLAE